MRRPRRRSPEPHPAFSAFLAGSADLGADLVAALACLQMHDLPHGVGTDGRDRPLLSGPGNETSNADGTTNTSCVKVTDTFIYEVQERGRSCVVARVLSISFHPSRHPPCRW